MMPQRAENLWIRGLVAGGVGALALAFWFLLVDAAQGAPFRTPGLLAGSLFGVENFESRPGMITLYTLIHFAAFAVVGVALTWTIRTLETTPSVLIGTIVGFVLFDIVFFGSVYVTGLDVVGELGWVEVLAGNLIAGISMTGYLHLTGTATPVTWWEAMADHKIVREGIVTGVIGALTVALWFLFVDLGRGQPFFTPAALGSALFLGIGGVEAVEVTVWTVLGYTMVHLALFIIVGVVASAIAWQAEKTPPLILGAVLLFVAFEAFFLGLLAVVAEFLLGPLAWWAIAVGNLLAVIAMGTYLWIRHPKLRDALAADPFDRTA